MVSLNFYLFKCIKQFYKLIFLSTSKKYKKIAESQPHIFVYFSSKILVSIIDTLLKISPKVQLLKFEDLNMNFPSALLVPYMSVQFEVDQNTQ